MVAPSNAAAHAWVMRWPDWPAPALIIHGPKASGKTHLGTIWRNKSAQHFIDDAENHIGSRESEERLFHLYNSAKENKQFLLIAALTPPHQWNFCLPDLASRLKAAPSVAIEPPDDSLLAAMLVKLFHDRQIIVGADVMHYILPRIERTYEAARDLVERADHAALSNKSGVTVPLISKLL